jgi:hypothetical protein
MCDDLFEVSIWADRCAISLQVIRKTHHKPQLRSTHEHLRKQTTANKSAHKRCGQRQGFEKRFGQGQGCEKRCEQGQGCEKRCGQRQGCGIGLGIGRAWRLQGHFSIRFLLSGVQMIELLTAAISDSGGRWCCTGWREAIHGWLPLLDPMRPMDLGKMASFRRWDWCRGTPQYLISVAMLRSYKVSAEASYTS